MAIVDPFRSFVFRSASQASQVDVYLLQSLCTSSWPGQKYKLQVYINHFICALVRHMFA